MKYILNKKFGLGKGLGALIPEEKVEEKSSNNEDGINL